MNKRTILGLLVAVGLVAACNQATEQVKDEANKVEIVNAIFHRSYDRYLKIFYFQCDKTSSYTKKIDNKVQVVVRKEFDEEFKSGLFKKAATYKNGLSCFENEDFYKNVRCGLLHQGETYGKFIIRRDTSKLFDPTTKVLNAKLFCDASKSFLESYKSELINSKWDSDIWDKCRIKIRHIIQNSR